VTRDSRAQKAFGLPQGAKDQPIEIVFEKQWAAVIHEWFVRYGSKVSGWSVRWRLSEGPLQRRDRRTISMVFIWTAVST